MSVPRSIAAGTTLFFTETLSGYPASLWTLAFILNLDGVFVANIAGGANGNNFIVTAPIATTAAWKPGQYNFAERVTEIAAPTNIIQVCIGQIAVTPDFSVSATPTPSQVQLTAIEAAILILVASPNSSVNFNGQSMTQQNLKEMFDIRDRLKVRVEAELLSAGLSTKGGARRIVTRFEP